MTYLPSKNRKVSPHSFSLVNTDLEQLDKVVEEMQVKIDKLQSIVEDLVLKLNSKIAENKPINNKK